MDTIITYHNERVKVLRFVTIHEITTYSSTHFIITHFVHVDICKIYLSVHIKSPSY